MAKVVDGDLMNEGRTTGIISENIPTKYESTGENGDMKKPGRRRNDQVSKVIADSDGTSQYHVSQVLPDVMHW